MSFAMRIGGLSTTGLMLLLTTSGCARKTCEHNQGHSWETLPRFSLTVTLPDGSVQSCATAQPPDGGSGWPSPLGGRVTGRVTESYSAAFSLDTCEAGTGCSPEVYWFAIDTSDLSLDLPPGRQVTATWLFSFFMACPQEFVLNDGAPSDPASGTSAALWLAGADSTIQPSSPLPFSVVQQGLYCNPNPGLAHPCGGGAPPPDDYALVFTPASGEPPLSLVMGKTGTLALTPAPGLLQHLTVRNLRSYQTERCDDYWNWAWWAAGHAGPSGLLE
jgi:hypothetical protein